MSVRSTIGWQRRLALWLVFGQLVLAFATVGMARNVEGRLVLDAARAHGTEVLRPPGATTDVRVRTERRTSNGTPVLAAVVAWHIASAAYTTSAYAPLLARASSTRPIRERARGPPEHG